MTTYNEYTHHEQCDDYYKALEERDGWKAHLLHLPSTQTPPYIIEMRENMRMRKEALEEEQRFVDSLTPELREVHIKRRWGIKEETETPKFRGLFSFLNVFYK